MGVHVTPHWVFLGFLFLACQSAHVKSEELFCADRNVSIQGTVHKDVRDGCEAVLAAFRFFESSGLPIPNGVVVRIVDDQHSPNMATHETGNYDAQRNVIHVIAYQAAVTATEHNELGLGRITSRPHWRSYIAHEVAHAAVHSGCDNACPSRAIHEYIAAVVQLSSLPKQAMKVLLEPYRDLEPFDEMSEISEIYYAINPHFFAVKSYKHFQRLADPRAFLQGILHPAD